MKSKAWQGRETFWTEYDVVSRASLTIVLAGNQGYWRFEPVGWITEVLASVGSPHVVAIAISVPDPYWKARALAAVARVLAQAGDTKMVPGLVADAKAAAASIADAGWRAQVLQSGPINTDVQRPIH